MAKSKKEIEEDYKNYLQTLGDAKNMSDEEKVIGFMRKLITEALIEEGQDPEAFLKALDEDGEESDEEFDDFEDDYPHFIESPKVLKYTLRITLHPKDPAIWRKVEVPSNMTLRHLGELIIDIFGWGGYHLNQFMVGQGRYTKYYEPESQAKAYPGDLCPKDSLYQEEYSIGDILTEKGRTVTFEYDFGDSWSHKVKLSSVEPYKEGEKHHVRFISGKGACPPDDCGGIWGYLDLLSILEKKKAKKRLTSEERERLDWYEIEKDYDPDYIDIEECAYLASCYED